MASKAFGSAKRPAGKKFRDGLVGEALDDLYSDIDEAFTAAEAGTLLGDAAITFGGNSAVTASPSTQIASYVVQHDNTPDTTTLEITVPYNCQILSFSLAVTAPTGAGGTVDLKKSVPGLLLGDPPIVTPILDGAAPLNIAGQNANTRLEATIDLSENTLAAGNKLQIVNINGGGANGYIAIIELVKVS